MHIAKKYARYTPEVSSADLKMLKCLIDRNNRIADSVHAIPTAICGNQDEGNRVIQKCFTQISVLMDTMMSDNKTFKDWLNNQSPAMHFSGYHIFRDKYPVPWIALARIDYAIHGILVLEILAGSRKAFHAFSPASERLLTDASQNRFVDGTDLNAMLVDWMQKDKDRQWKVFQGYDLFTEIEFQMHYLLEKNDYFEMAGIAQAMGLNDIVKVFRIKVFVDAVLLASTEKRIPLDSEIIHIATRCAFGKDILLEFPADKPLSVSQSAHKEIQSLIREIETPLRRFLAEKDDRESIFPVRSRAGILLGSLAGGANPSPPGQMVEINRLAETCIQNILQILLEDISNTIHGSAPALRGQAVDIVDLDSRQPSRKLLAAAQIQEEIFPQFMAASGISDLYEVDGKEVPDCPMPYSGVFPIAIRQKAAVFAKLTEDLKKPNLPEHLFQFKENPDMEKAEADAYKQIHAKFSTVFNNWMTVLDILDKVSAAGRLYDAWATLGEMMLTYMGHGVDSVDDLLVPFFFFSRTRFLQLIEGENRVYRSVWLRIRETLSTMVSDIRNRNWQAVKLKIDSIFRDIHDLSLSRVNNDATVANPFSWTTHSLFSAPAHLSQKTMLVDDSLAPVELVVAPPGNSKRYQRLVLLNQQFIRLLRRLQVQPVEEAAAIKGHAKSGPVFDTNRLHLFQLGHCLFSTVAYRPEPIAGKKYLICILFDFSGSMEASLVSIAKNIAIILAEGLREQFELQLYLYNTSSEFYRLTQIYDSKTRAICGNAGLSSICRQGLDSGSGWNPDAAIILAVRKMLEKRREESAIIIHLGDHEYCRSLSRRDCENAGQEMFYAASILTGDGHRYIAAKVGQDQDPFAASNLPHQYLHFDETITRAKIEELYQAIARACAE